MDFGTIIVDLELQGRETSASLLYRERNTVSKVLIMELS